MGSSSPTRELTRSPALGAWCLSQWTTREVPRIMFMMSSRWCGKMRETKLHRFLKQQQERLVENNILTSCLWVMERWTVSSFCISAWWLDFLQWTCMTLIMKKKKRNFKSSVNMKRLERKLHNWRQMQHTSAVVWPMSPYTLKLQVGLACGKCCDPPKELNRVLPGTHTQRGSTWELTGKTEHSGLLCEKRRRILDHRLMGQKIIRVLGH